MDMETKVGSSQDSYWILLSVIFAAGIVLIGLAQGAALLWATLTLVVVILGFAALHGQFRKGIVKSLSTASPGLGIAAASIVAVAVLFRGTDVALWVIPILALVTAVGMFAWLRRHGKYEPRVPV